MRKKSDPKTTEKRDGIMANLGRHKVLSRKVPNIGQKKSMFEGGKFPQPSQNVTATSGTTDLSDYRQPLSGAMIAKIMRSLSTSNSQSLANYITDQQLQPPKPQQNDLDGQGIDPIPTQQVQLKADPLQRSPQPQERPNLTGLPDRLKTGIENLSGYSSDYRQPLSGAMIAKVMRSLSTSNSQSLANYITDQQLQPPKPQQNDLDGQGIDPIPTQGVQLKADPVQRSPQPQEQLQQDSATETPSASVGDPVLQGKGEMTGDPQDRSSQEQPPNLTGLPDRLKTGIENLSGYSMDDVRVHYNSDKPGQLQAHAYAQGTDIHVASGQEKHLPHEAWHVVQQKQGRVQPTYQYKGTVINDEADLEKEADLMGLTAQNYSKQNPPRKNPEQSVSNPDVYQLTGYGAATLGGGFLMGVGALLQYGLSYGLSAYRARKRIESFERSMSNSGFVDNARKREQNFVLAALKEGLSEEAARRLYKISGANAKDTVTGFDVASDRQPSVENAIEFVKGDTQRSAFYVEVDIKNLGGLNSVLGHSGADEVYKKMAIICDNHVKSLEEKNAQVARFRHGGDEFSFLVVSPDGLVDEGDVETSLKKAQSKIKEEVEDKKIGSFNKNPEGDYTTNDKLAIIEHPKHKNNHRYNGTGIVFGVSQIFPQHKTASDVYQVADIKVEKKKLSETK
ncbi:DUF4157 domain-containing protein [Moorena producens JHB]|uniref:DUF4157 domain-containing protein n=1 Tax=Moorena producens (strain JHB) TaxID=1454205 RepID=A0A1D9G7J1_MOOP1|nr:DUF4157 domain-containing protein [Moorena producens]AOY83609.2 DUF4157 domain-containing protein [Moorena producens JHB]